jgi:hypothetical protein
VRERLSWLNRVDAIRVKSANEYLMYEGVCRRHETWSDFAKWITACEPALGWRDGEFMEIYAANRAAMTEVAIESDETIKMIRDEPICHG